MNAIPAVTAAPFWLSTWANTRGSLPLMIRSLPAPATRPEPPAYPEVLGAGRRA
jgi:hypothetical protein